MDQSYSLDRASLADARDLAALGASTFSASFGHLYDPKDLQAYLRDQQSAAFYEAAIGSIDMAVWLVRARDGSPAAYAVAGRNTLPVEDAGPRAGEVKRIYVDEAHQGKGLGHQLADITIEWLTGRRFTPVFVGVWSENTCAQRLYARYGFEKVGEYQFAVGEARDHEFIFRRTKPLDGRRS